MMRSIETSGGNRTTTANSSSLELVLVISLIREDRNTSRGVVLLLMKEQAPSGVRFAIRLKLYFPMPKRNPVLEVRTILDAIWRL
jgi:hypothetical protein